MVVYMTTNLINGKKYIGRDKNNKKSYLGSGSLIQRAIEKYGKHNFKKEILEVCASHEELIKREEYWLDYYDASNNDNFYNVSNTSYGAPTGEKHHFYGKHHSKDFIEFLRESNIGSNNAFYGKYHTKESKIKMSKSKKGKTLEDENPNFRGYVVCVSGRFLGQRMTINQWSKLLQISRQKISSHITGYKYKNGIKGIFLIRENNLDESTFNLNKAAVK